MEHESGALSCNFPATNVASYDTPIFLMRQVFVYFLLANHKFTDVVFVSFFSANATNFDKIIPLSFIRRSGALRQWECLTLCWCVCLMCFCVFFSFLSSVNVDKHVIKRLFFKYIVWFS